MPQVLGYEAPADGVTVGKDASTKAGFHGSAAVRGTALADITVTGTYGTDDDAIEAAINGILAVLRSHGLIASS